MLCRYFVLFIYPCVVAYAWLVLAQVLLFKIKMCDKHVLTIILTIISALAVLTYHPESRTSWNYYRLANELDGFVKIIVLDKNSEMSIK